MTGRDVAGSYVRDFHGRSHEYCSQNFDCYVDFEQWSVDFEWRRMFCAAEGFSGKDARKSRREDCGEKWRENGGKGGRESRGYTGWHTGARGGGQERRPYEIDTR